MEILIRFSDSSGICRVDSSYLDFQFITSIATKSTAGNAQIYITTVTPYYLQYKAPHFLRLESRSRFSSNFNVQHIFSLFTPIFSPYLHYYAVVEYNCVPVPSFVPSFLCLCSAVLLLCAYSRTHIRKIGT
jgi:hypothetical protein